MNKFTTSAGNRCQMMGDLIEMDLTQGQKCHFDAEDLALVQGRRWCAHRIGNTFYAATGRRENGKSILIHMHRVLVPGEHDDVDHIDGNGLNNRRSNLRACSRSENLWNQCAKVNTISGLKGVTWCPNRGKWHARIVVKGKTHHLGNHVTAQQAHAAYCAAALKFHGEFANTGDRNADTQIGM